jgi:hypothetical protein
MSIPTKVGIQFYIMVFLSKSIFYFDILIYLGFRDSDLGFLL